MKIIQIHQMPTSVDEIPVGTKGVHESMLRAYQILEKAKEYLALGVPSGVVLDLIAEMEASCQRKQ